MTYVTEKSPIQSVEVNTSSTCSECPHFNDYLESSGRGRCNLFDSHAKKSHTITNDCINTSNLLVLSPVEDESDRRSEYQVGDVVKIIDANKHHTEWASFKIAKVTENKEIYQSSEAYLNQPQWLYTLVGFFNKKFEVGENEICAFDMAWNVNPNQDIF